MSATVLIGLLGCGPSAERVHLPAIQALRTVRLTVAYDPSPARREAIARLAPGCRPVPSAEALFETGTVDAVIIAAPLAKRATLAVRSLGARIPILIEPPMAASVEEGTWIRDAEQAVRLPVMVGYNRRWWRPVELVRGALASGDKAEPDTGTRGRELHPSTTRAGARCPRRECRRRHAAGGPEPSSGPFAPPAGPGDRHRDRSA